MFQKSPFFFPSCLRYIEKFVTGLSHGQKGEGGEVCRLQSIVYDQMEETSSKGLTEATFKEHGIISLAVLKLISCVPKIADFFPSCLRY